MTTLDCGVPAHEAECLCDVVITKPTPVNYGGHELDHAGLVMRYHELGAPWDGDKLAVLLDGLDRARAARDLLRDHELDPEHLSTYTDLVKELVIQGQSMIDIPSIVGLSLRETAAALMSGQVHAAITAWNAADWLAFEADALGPFTVRELASRHHIGKSVAHRLKGLYKASAAALA